MSAGLKAERFMGGRVGRAVVGSIEGRAIMGGRVCRTSIGSVEGRTITSSNGGRAVSMIFSTPVNPPQTHFLQIPCCPS